MEWQGVEDLAPYEPWQIEYYVDGATPWPECCRLFKKHAAYCARHGDIGFDEWLEEVDNDSAQNDRDDDFDYAKLPVGHPKKRKSKIKYVMSTANILHRSIERRALSVLSRQSFGHWEEDSIVGKRTGKKESCLVLTERATRQEIVIKVCDKTPQCTTKAMKELKHTLGKDFTKIFKTLTVDNGVEFTNQQGFDDLGLTVFYCHPHAPHERGSNENNNKLLRRHFPKGQSMKDKTQEDATRAQHFINSYPREMFHGKCSSDLFKEQLEKLNLDDPERVYRFFNLQ